MASTSVLKLKVDDKEYNAGLKHAQQGMLALEKSLRDAGKTFSQVDDAVVEYVRSVGKMETVSNTASGRMAELKRTFTELSTQYNRLTDQERESPFGKALSQSLDELAPRIRRTKAELDDINKKITGVSAPVGGGLFAGLGDKMSGALQVFAGNMLTKAAGAVTSLGSEIFAAIQQGTELARQGEGIRVAFERLGRGDILDGLRQATHGTVTDIELMKAAVKFNDFKLPVEELGTMLAFAQQKAKDTGQSVDYMVDSIVTGLGRKSLMILDNLGLSAAEIKDKMAETGDMTKAVGAIIREQMSKAGDYVETAADRAAQANVSLQNKMEELGRKFAPVEEASNQLWTSMKIGILDIVGGPLARLINDLTEAGRLKNALNDMNGDGSDGKETHTGKALRQLREYSGGKKGVEGKRDLYNLQVASYSRQEEDAWRSVNRLREELDKLRKQQRESPVAGNLSPLISDTSKQLENAENRAKALHLMLSEYKKGAKDILQPVKADIDTSQAEQNVDTLRVKLAELEAQRKKAVRSGDQEQIKSLTQQINQTKTNIKALDPTALKTTTKKKVETFAPDSIAAQEKLVQDLRKKWNEAGADIRDQYIAPLIEAEKKLKSIKDRLALLKEQSQGKLLGDARQTTITASVTADTRQALDKLREIDGIRIDAKSMTVTADTRQALDKLREIDGIRIDDKTIKVNVESQGLQTSGLGSLIDTKPLSGTFDLSAIAKLRKKVQDELKAEKIEIDQNIFKEAFQASVQNGIDGMDITFSGLSDKIAKGIDIPDETWKKLFKEINGKLKAMGIAPIEINLKTGKVESSDDSDGKSNRKNKNKNEKYEPESISDAIKDLAGDVGGIFSGLQQLGIELPRGLQDVIGGIQGVMTILTSINAILGVIEGLQAVGVLPFFAHGGLVGKAAGGMLIPGNSMSGDNLRMPVADTGGMIGVNSGELILNKSQQDNLANALEGGGMQGISLSAQVTGEQIMLVANRHLRRIGEGEILTWR